MANIATTTSVLNHTTTAGYQAWVTEIITTLFTTLGLTQTADTGQTTNGGSSVPGINTAGGYVIGRFNDTLQSTQPIFFKLEFGTGASSADPQMWITVGQSSNGSGTIGGTTMTRCVVTSGTTVASTVTSYVSRFVYNATFGVFSMVWKIGSTSNGVNSSYGGLTLFRSNNSSGASTGDAAILITNSTTTTANNGAIAGQMQVYSYDLAAIVTIPTVNSWGLWPLLVTTTTYSSQVSCVPIFTPLPFFTLPAFLAIALLGEVPLGGTVSLAMVGSTPLTFLSVGTPWGGTGFGANCTSAAHSMLILWQ